jgi:hypothetical protein
LADVGFPYPPGLKDAARLASADRLSAATAASSCGVFIGHQPIKYTEAAIGKADRFAFEVSFRRRRKTVTG